MTGVFWVLIALVFYCYLGYPAILAIFSKVFYRKVNKGKVEPGVSVVLSVWNEEEVIESKIHNFLTLDYPEEKFEVLIGSDGSTDKTNTLVEKYKEDGVRLIVNHERKGKMATVNRLVKEARYEVIVFTDARQNFAHDAIRELVANFADPKVGCVSGELIFSRKKGGTARGINLYWRYEKWIRSLESQIHSMLGATGAIYAIRKELYTPIPERTVLDDVYVPFHIIKKGFRAVFDETAQAFDEVADNPREEHNRKARTLFGNYQIFAMMPEMFNPFQSPVAIQLFSHKFLRVVIPFLLILIFVINGLLLGDPFYRGMFILQILFYLMAVLGGLARHKEYGMLKLFLRLCYVPYVFCLLNFSALIGFLRFIRKNQEVTWDKARKA